MIGCPCGQGASRTVVDPTGADESVSLPLQSDDELLTDRNVRHAHEVEIVSDGGTYRREPAELVTGKWSDCMELG
jgi:hypothetical protein